jgi:hypothetical protein
MMESVGIRAPTLLETVIVGRSVKHFGNKKGVVPMPLDISDLAFKRSNTIKQGHRLDYSRGLGSQLEDAEFVNVSPATDPTRMDNIENPQVRHVQDELPGLFYESVG